PFGVARWGGGVGGGGGRPGGGGGPRRERRAAPGGHRARAARDLTPLARSLRLAVDGTPLLRQATGVGEVAHGLLETLAGRDDLELVAYALTFRGRHQLAQRIPAGVRPAVRPIPARLVRALWLRSGVPRVQTWTGPVDVVHATFIGPPARSPVVVTIHDLTFERFPEPCTPGPIQHGRLVRRAIDRGAVVPATSEFVAAEVREHFGIDDSRTAQIPLG